MGLSVRRERRDGIQVTVISGDVEGPDVVEELTQIIRLVAQDQRLALDVSKLSGLTDDQRQALIDAVDSIVGVTGR